MTRSGGLAKDEEIPRISECCGIAIGKYQCDHAPSHFHAIYGEFEAEIRIAVAYLGRTLRRVRRLGPLQH